MTVQTPMLIQLDPRQPASGGGADRAQVLQAVMRDGLWSRPQLVERLGLRSTTVSRVVGELVQRRLLLEASGKKQGRGRPAATLRANPAVLGASVLHVASRDVVGVLVDLSGRVLHRDARTVGPDADNEAMSGILAGIASRLRAATPPGMEHAGTAAAVSGVVDLQGGRWLASSRWPRLCGLDLGAALSPAAAPVRVARQLEAELQARLLAEPALRSGGTLLLHWGWGIGLAYAVDGTVFNAAGGPFGEIGHWRFRALAGRRCGCGQEGCLETGAALWALLPQLRDAWPELAEDEAELAGQLRERDLTTAPALRQAATLVAQALANLCRLLFPGRVLVSGPFSAQPGFWTQFETAFRQEGSIGGLGLPPLVPVSSSVALAIEGAAAPLLTEAVQARLRDVPPGG